MTDTPSLPPGPWLSLLIQAGQALVVRVNNFPLAWQTPTMGAWREGLEVRRVARNGAALAHLTLRALPDRSSIAFFLRVTEHGDDVSGRSMESVELTVAGMSAELWEKTRRVSLSTEDYADNTNSYWLALPSTLLLTGQAVCIGGVLCTAGETPDVPHWWDWVDWNYDAHPLLVGEDVPHADDDYAVFLAREQDKLRYPDAMHRSIFGMLEGPGATGAQNDLCWIPSIDGRESDARQSAWQEACRPTHFYADDGEIKLAIPDQTVFWNGRPVGHDDTGAKGWRGHDRQHYSLNYLCAVAARTDDPIAWHEVRAAVETWIGNHPVSSGTPKDSLDSPRAVGRGMAAGVKLWLLTRDERLKAQILRRADRVHAVLSERIQKGEQPVLEVRGPDPRALPVDHSRPWEEATAAIGMAMVARVFGRPQDYWASAVLALNVMQTGYRDDGQIAFAMAWPTPAKADLRPGVNVVYADGTEFRLWTRAALQWVEFMTAQPGLLGEHAGMLSGPIHERAQQLLAMTPAPSDPIQLAAYQRWCISFDMIGP